MAKSRAVVKPNLGLYLDRPPLAIPSGALRSGSNFRIFKGVLSNLLLGWEKLSTDWTLRGPVALIASFEPRDLGTLTIFGDLQDLYLWNQSANTVSFLTPRYETGLVATTSGSKNVTGSGTSWAANVKSGDFIYIDATGQTDPAATWYEIDTVTDDTHLVLVDNYPTTSSSKAYTIRKLFSGIISHPWSWDIFYNDGVSGDDLWLATDGIDPVISWNGTDDQVTLHSELGFVCQSIGVYSNMALYGGLSGAGVYDSPQSFVNSDVGSPLLVGDTGTGLSEQFAIYAGVDPIFKIMPLGDYVVFYSEKHVVLGQFVGGDTVFQFRQVIRHDGPVAGPLAGRAVAAYGNYHEYLAIDGQFRFDGVAVQRINTQVWTSVLASLDPARSKQTFTQMDESYGAMLWSLPLTTDTPADSGPTLSATAYVEHYLEQVPPTVPTPFSKRAFPFGATGTAASSGAETWDTVSGTWADALFTWEDASHSSGFLQLLAGDVNGQVYVLNTVQNADGTPLDSFVRFGRSPVVDGRQRGLLVRIYPFAQKLDTSMIVSAYLGDSASTQLTASGDFTFDTSLPEGGHFVAVYRRGRYMEVRFGSPTEAWALEGYDIDVRSGGTR